MVLRGTVKSYRTAGAVVRAVRGIDVSIAPGETVALLGPNGAGKSTTIDMPLGLITPDSGSVSLMGGPPRDAVARGMVGAMLQAGALIRDVTPRELLTMMASLHPTRSRSPTRSSSPDGLTEIADRRTQKLSGGQAQRVRFALALVADPAVLILDEPTVGIDVEARRGFWALVRGFAARGKTVIFATHYLEEADAYADRVIVMSHGQVVADGPTSEARAQVGCLFPALPRLARGRSHIANGHARLERRTGLERVAQTNPRTRGGAATARTHALDPVSPRFRYVTEEQFGHQRRGILDLVRDRARCPWTRPQVGASHFRGERTRRCHIPAPCRVNANSH